jgi:hypothetical protein
MRVQLHVPSQAFSNVAYKVSGAISAPFGQEIVPPSMRARLKKIQCLQGSKHWPFLKIVGKIDIPGQAVIEGHLVGIVFYIVDANHIVHVPHDVFLAI